MMNHERRRIAHFLRSSFIILISSFLLTGCTAVGVAAYKIAGPPPVEAKYVPPQESMLVLVENYRDASSTQIDAELLTRYLIEKLRAHNVAPVVDYDSLETLRMDPARDYHAMKLDQIGKALGAKQVLYIDLVSSEINRPLGGETFTARGAAQIKVVDATTGQTRWPADNTVGEPVAFQAPALSADQGGNDPMLVRQKLEEGMADQIARLFYKHDAEEAE
jgi:hypothetical protein